MTVNSTGSRGVCTVKDGTEPTPGAIRIGHRSGSGAGRRRMITTRASSVVLASAVMMIALAGQSAAAQAPGTGAQPPGIISTAAGGLGGPAKATSVSFYSPYTCGTVQYA